MTPMQTSECGARTPAAIPSRPGALPRSVAVVRRDADDARALTALLSDAGASCASLESFELESLRSLGCEAVVVFARDLEVSELVGTARALHALQPNLAIVFVAPRHARTELFDAFERAAAPPVILRESAPVTVIRDALRVACEAVRFEQALYATPPTEGNGDRDAAGVIVRMRDGREPTNDLCFDRFLPPVFRQASSQYWTPVDAILRAASWLDELGLTRVVDIGSGVGKFCIVAATVTRCSFVGIEQRPELNRVAKRLCQTFGVEERVTLVDGTFGEVPLPPADCYYLFNPFEENLLPTTEALDATVELTPDRFRRDLRAFRALVASLPLGTHVLTYNGVGGRLPPCLDELRVDRELPTVLRLLRKVRE